MTLLSFVGVQWVEMHKLAERVELEEMKRCGILHGDIEDMMKVHPYNCCAVKCVQLCCRSTCVLDLCHTALGTLWGVRCMMWAGTLRQVT